MKNVRGCRIGFLTVVISMRESEFVFIYQGCQNKAPQTEWLEQRELFSHNCGGSKSEHKVTAELAASNQLPAWPVDGDLPQCLHTVLPLAVCVLTFV